MEPIQLTIGGDTKRSKKGKHPVKIDWNALPDASQFFIINYGLRQYLADGMAGAETEAEAAAAIAERTRKLTEADFSRTRGEGTSKPDTVDVRALRLAKEFLRNRLKEANQTVEKDKIAEAAAKLVETSTPMDWKAEAKKQLDAEAKTRESAAKAEAIDILSLVGIVPVEVKEGEAETDDEAA